MNRFYSSHRILLVTIVIILLAGASGLYFKRGSVQRYEYMYQTRHELEHQMQPIRGQLTALGFTTLPPPKVGCASYPEPGNSGKHTSTCSASISKYIVLGSGPAVATKLNTAAEELSKDLTSNGWKQRPDLRTIAWFKAISQGVDYQPDQLNAKQIGDMACTIDFFTAFSKPAPPAINMMAMCTKPANPILL